MEKTVKSKLHSSVTSRLTAHCSKVATLAAILSSSCSSQKAANSLASSWILLSFSHILCRHVTNTNIIMWTAHQQRDGLGLNYENHCCYLFNVDINCDNLPPVAPGHGWMEHPPPEDNDVPIEDTVPAAPYRMIWLHSIIQDDLHPVPQMQCSPHTYLDDAAFKYLFGASYSAYHSKGCKQRCSFDPTKLGPSIELLAQPTCQQSWSLMRSSSILESVGAKLL